MKKVLLAMTFAGVLAAQPFGPGMGGGRRLAAGGADELKSALNLTDQQVTKLRDLRAAQFQAMQPLLQQLRTNHTTVRDKAEAGGDPAEIGKLVLAGENLRKQLRAMAASHQKEALAVLTPAQLETVKKLEEAEKLMPALGQARALGLLTPSDDAGPGFGGFGPMRGMRRGIGGPPFGPI